MLKDTITSDLTAAMKARDQVRLSTLRMVQTSIKNAEVEKRRALTDEEVLEAVGKEAKRRREAIAAYTDAARTDLVDKETAELKVLEAYLPAGLTDEELAAIVDEAIAETGATEAKQMGVVMKALMPKVKGRADGTAISAMVRTKLGS